MSCRNAEEALARLRAIDEACRRLERMSAALQWDQETYLPPDAVNERAEQIAMLETLRHDRFTADETGELLESFGPLNAEGGGLDDTDRHFLTVFRRAWNRAVRLPGDFVAHAAAAEAVSQAAWAQARRGNNFAAFLPHLREMISIARQKAGFWGYSGDSAYDGLLDIYEPAMPAAKIKALFSPLRQGLVDLLGKIASRPQVDASFVCGGRVYGAADQAAFASTLMDYLGFDRRRGRLDVSAHPFTTTLGASDVRITTRYFETNPLSGIFSVIHESGHAFYELGFPPELGGGCLADGASMAFHESQSRFWENVIGRSRPFWRGLYPRLQAVFPSQLAGVDSERFYRAVNRVSPSLIRVDADEVSYCLHIILRFDLEEQLIGGSLDPAGLPEIWREKSKEYLGVVPETDADGVLQDVHWSMGDFGYFPSYALGNLYGLAITEKLRADIPGLDGRIEAGNFADIRAWLAEKVWRWGCRLEPAELLRRITGGSVSVEPFLNYLNEKYSDIYGWNTHGL